MSSYYSTEPWNEEEYYPPSFQQEVREKIMYIEQSRDETLDEYLWYFGSLVTSCPHHGFTNYDLLQRFLGGMMPHEWDRLNEEAGGSVNNLDMDELWDLIEDMAERSKPIQEQTKSLEDMLKELAASNQQLVDMMEQSHAKIERGSAELSRAMSKLRRSQEEDVGTRTEEDMAEALIEPISEPIEPAEDEDQWLKEEELKSDYPEYLEEDSPLAPKEEPTEPLESDLIIKLPETCSDLITDLPEAEPVLIIKAPEEEPVITIKATEEIKVTSIEDSTSVKGADASTIYARTYEELPINQETSAADKQETSAGSIHSGKDPGILTLTHDIDSYILQTGDASAHSLLALILGQSVISDTRTKNNMGTKRLSPVLARKKSNYHVHEDSDHPYMRKRPRHGTFGWKPGWRDVRAPFDEGYKLHKGVQKFNLEQPWDPNL